MLSEVILRNFGPIDALNWSDLGPINLVIGGNDTGKTFLLKCLYSTIRTSEEYRRGDDQRTAAEILAEKLYWTFQPDKIGDLVTEGSAGALDCKVTIDGRVFHFSFGKDTTKQISTLEDLVQPRSSNSIFLPAKEVLSLYQIILKSREQDKVFGFDDTYLDLARALRQITTNGRNDPEFAKSRTSQDSMFGGRVEYDDASGRWLFKKGNKKYPIGVTAEGVKKIAILDTLLDNRYLDASSIIFIDKPESALHPRAVAQFLDIVALLAKSGIQFFLASHSYFVMKKLFLITQQQELSIPVVSAHESRWTASKLEDGIPENTIIDESIHLYEQEVELALKLYA